jgi:tRNA threonylcarbamoyladenosine biosynthesis protein TsaE
MVVVYNITQIYDVASKVLAHFGNKKVWAFYAPMGAGKTTFIHALCDVLQVTDVVSSPTFAIINEYTSPRFATIYHMDWYRLKSEEEAINAGVEDALQHGDLCLVEWPEKAPDLLPDDVVNIAIELIDTATRQMTVH